ncbi:MAG TPA: hypothetical protein DCL41_08380 [Bdellovibrionales bacterium]|nr:hypothetical protein [Pseudobdellovibrionaceae bacterium]HAG91873.1 hypothetical protein [Bdellovibrionales bacterium]
MALRWEKILEFPPTQVVWMLASGSLPFKEDQPFPEDILVRIQAGGIEAHAAEICRAFEASSQSRVDQYRKIKKSQRSRAKVKFSPAFERRPCFQNLSLLHVSF